MPVFGARGRAGKSSREQAKSREQRAEQAKNQAEVKQAVNEVQQIADTIKQSKQTANSYTEEVKPVTFKPVVYVQNNYGSGEFTTAHYVVFAYFAIIVLIEILWNKIKGRKKNNNTDQNGKSGCEYNSETIKSGKKETLTSNIMTIIAASIMILCTLVVIGEILLKL